MQLQLTQPLVLAGATMEVLTFGTMGERLYAYSKSRCGSAGFTPEAIVEIAARLTGRSPITLRRLCPDDLAALGRVVEDIYVVARQQHRVHRAAHGERKAYGQGEAAE